MTETKPTLRVATLDDAVAIDALMKTSGAVLFPRFYDERQAASAVRYVSQVDPMLLEDGTYFVLEMKDELVACGGWSRRDKLYTGSGDDADDARALDPATEPARVRAMFVRADWTRRGLGRRILEACEEAARAEGFRTLALVATLPGLPLYLAYGFESVEETEVTMPDGVTIPCVAMEMRIPSPEVSTAAQFSGIVPATYDEVLGPVLFEAYAQDVVARLPAGNGLRVLEIACGTGIVTRRLQEALSGRATLVATDLNQPMVDYARRAVASSEITWQQADAQSLPFADGSQDVVVCQFGYMFLPDKVQGFRESRRVLAPGGALIANVWTSLDANPFARAMHDALAAAFPEDPPRFLETPYGYEEDRVRADMAAAGWESVHFETLEFEIPCPSASHFARGFSHGSPLTHELTARGADLGAMTELLARAVIPVGGEQPFTARLSAFVITGAR